MACADYGVAARAKFPRRPRLLVFQSWRSTLGQSPYGLKLSAIVTQAIHQPVLFVDADILWFRDPMLLLGDPALWGKPRALRESNCHQSRDMALHYCVQVLEPPFVNSGIVALHGELMTPELLRSMVQEALRSPQDSRASKPLSPSAVKLGGGLFPEKLCLVGSMTSYRFRSRDMKMRAITPATTSTGCGTCFTVMRLSSVSSVFECLTKKLRVLTHQASCRRAMIAVCAS